MAIRTLPFLLLLTLTISFLSPKSSASLTPEEEKQTLLQIKNNFWGNPPSLHSWQDYNHNNNKSSTTTHCKWTGIYCSSDGFITNISLPNQNIHGEIPDSFGDLSSLQQLDLSINNLTGPIPAGIWMLFNLTTVLMNDNQLSCTLPEKLPWNISRLEIANNRFSGKLPSTAGNLQVFEANNNQFSGEIPANLAGFSRLQVLLLGGNGISGEIPGAISELRNLNTLDLSDNRLSGEIPAEIWSMPVLTALDLSGNTLTGEIPQAMGDLRLNSLNLSSNQLAGEVPQRLQNRAYERSFLANPGLCSPSTVLDLGACDRKSDGRAQISVALIVCIVLGGYVLLGAVIFALGGKSGHFKRPMDSVDSTTWTLTQFQTLDFNVARISEGLTERNLIGSGGGGQVYKIVLGDRAGETVAVKKIWRSRKLDSKLEKEFQAEVRILGSIRHSNIVKLICCISSVDSKLLVSEYMENESLDRWLHRKHRAEPNRYTKLDWRTRLSIVIGAAKGLCYMHHDCNPPIVHGDVKSSNILLDAEFMAKIADFGLARMLVNVGEPETVSAVVGSSNYMAPECANTRQVNEKIDVYSFGVVLLELTTGREAHDGGDDGSLAEWARRQLQVGDQQLIDAIDEEIRDPANMQEIEKVFELGVNCTGETSGRPTMKEVLQVLLQIDQTLVVGNQFDKENDVAPLLQTNRGSSHKRVSDSDQFDDDDLICPV